MIKIKGLSLQVGNKEVNLTLKEAKQLYEELEKLFEVEVQKEYIPYNTRPYYTWPNYTQPYWYSTTAGSPTVTYTGATTNADHYVTNTGSFEIDLNKF